MALTESGLDITSVSYSKLVNLGNYENEKVQATARVIEGQSPDTVLDSLKQWVAERVVDIAVARAERDKIDEAQYQLANIEAQLGGARRKWEAARKLLEKHGLPVESWEELPF